MTTTRGTFELYFLLGRPIVDTYTDEQGITTKRRFADLYPWEKNAIEDLALTEHEQWHAGAHGAFYYLDSATAEKVGLAAIQAMVDFDIEYRKERPKGSCSIWEVVLHSTEPGVPPRLLALPA